MIDFEQIEHIVPEDGSLTLKFTRKNGKLSVCYAPRYGKKDIPEITPVILSGKAAELGEPFGELVREVYPFEKLLATADDKVRQRKEKVATAVDGKKGGAGKGKTDTTEGGLFDKKKKAKPETPKAEAPQKGTKEECGSCEDDSNCAACGEGGQDE